MKQKSERIPIWFTKAFLLLLLSVYLLYPGVNGYLGITGAKARMFFVLCGGYAVASLVLLLELRIIGEKVETGRAFHWKEHIPELLVVVYWILSGVSTLLSVDRSVSFWGAQRYDGFLTITVYCLCFLLVMRFWEPDRLFLWVFGAAISLNCAVALLQLTGRNPLMLFPEGLTYYDGNELYSGQFLGTTGNIDLLAALLALAIPVFWIGVLRLKGRLRFLLLIPLALSLAVLFWAFVEGGILGLLAAAVITVFVLLPSKRARRIYGIAVIILALAGLAGLYVIGDRLPGAAGELAMLLHGQTSEKFGSGRFYIWKNVCLAIRERPLFGGGPDTLALRTDITFTNYKEAVGAMVTSVVDHAHNEYLNIGANQGLPALAAYLGLLVLGFLRWLKDARHSPAAAVCGGAVLAYSICVFFEITSVIVTPYFWVLLAVVMHGYLKAKEE